MRRAAAAIGVAALVAGCGSGGGSGKSHTATTSTKAAKPPPRPQYVPSARHKHRPPGYVYNDEVGENVLTATHDRIIEVFGPPASRHGSCIVYRVVRQPKSKWTFCFRGQKMVSANG